MPDSNTEMKQYLLSIIGNSPFGIISIDFSGRITIINQSAAGILDARSNLNSYLNLDVRQVISSIDEFNQNITSCIQEGRKAFDLINVAINHRIVNIRGRIVLDGMLITLADVTEIETAKNVLKERTIELEVKNRELEQFAYISSHDLQEPLLTIIGFSNLLLQENKSFSEEELVYLTILKESAERMSAQIKGLLEYSRLGKKKMMSTVNCNQLIKEIKQSLFAVIQEKGATITVKPLPTIKAYKEELKSLFQNLISNSIKFVKNGENPKIEIWANRKNGHWTFAFKDYGIGISEENKDNIFLIFKRLHNRDKYEGNGIGLSLCKKIVQMHDGDIWVESVPEKQTTFYFTIKNY